MQDERGEMIVVLRGDRLKSVKYTYLLVATCPPHVIGVTGSEYLYILVGKYDGDTSTCSQARL